MSDAANGMAAGGILGGFGKLYTGESLASSLESQAEVNEQSASLALFAGEQDAMRVGIRAARAIGAIKAGYGASGVRSDSGSVLNVLQASQTAAEMDVQNTLHGARIKAITLQNQAALNRSSANNARLASYIGAFGDFGQAAAAFGTG